jgi:hypothetical protein
MHNRLSRRSFLSAATAAASAAAATDAAAMPAIALGRHRVSRLIAGSNPINGYSHATQRLSDLMVQYFTVERTTEFLLHCERQGINTWQASYSPKVRDALRAARERGSRLQFICLTSEKQADVRQEILAMKPIAIVHHGSVTDALFQAGNSGAVRDFVRRVKDLGLLAGVSTHNPDFLARIEDSAWENDFYMTCLYNVTRSAEEIRRMVGGAALGELFLADDPQRMTARIRQVHKPCLAFKLLGAGRLSARPEGVERAFEFAFRNIKPGDAAIVGMFPILHDEVTQNAELVRRFGRPAA